MGENIGTRKPSKKLFIIGIIASELLHLAISNSLLPTNFVNVNILELGIG